MFFNRFKTAISLFTCLYILLIPDFSSAQQVFSCDDFSLKVGAPTDNMEATNCELTTFPVFFKEASGVTGDFFTASSMTIIGHVESDLPFEIDADAINDFLGSPSILNLVEINGSTFHLELAIPPFSTTQNIPLSTQAAPLFEIIIESWASETELVNIIIDQLDLELITDVGGSSIICNNPQIFQSPSGVFKDFPSSCSNSSTALNIIQDGTTGNFTVEIDNDQFPFNTTGLEFLVKIADISSNLQNPIIGTGSEFTTIVQTEEGYFLHYENDNPQGYSALTNILSFTVVEPALTGQMGQGDVSFAWSRLKSSSECCEPTLSPSREDMPRIVTFGSFADCADDITAIIDLNESLSDLEACEGNFVITVVPTTTVDFTYNRMVLILNYTVSGGATLVSVMPDNECVQPNCNTSFTDQEITYDLLSGAPITSPGMNLTFNIPENGCIEDIHFTTVELGSVSEEFHCVPQEVINFDMPICREKESGALLTENGKMPSGITTISVNCPTVADYEVEVSADCENPIDYEVCISCPEAYEITPNNNNNPDAGVTTFDMLLIRKHILTDIILPPYKMIAADVNLSESVTTVDILEIRKLILTSIPDFSPNESFRFIDASYVFPNESNPWQEIFPESITTNGTDNLDFTVIKVGDVNDTYDCDMNGLINDDENGLAILIQEVIAENYGFKLNFDVKSEQHIAAFQAAIDFEKQFISYYDHSTEAELQEFTKSNHFGTTDVANGKIRFAWDAPSGTGAIITENTKDFSLKFSTSLSLDEFLTKLYASAEAEERNSSSEQSSQLISLSKDFLNAAYDENGQRYSVSLKISKDFKVSEKEDIEVFPNPFTNYLLLDLPDNHSEVQYRIFDGLGRNIIADTKDLTEQSSIRLNTKDWNTGVYFYEIIDAENVKITGKLLKQ